MSRLSLRSLAGPERAEAAAPARLSLLSLAGAAALGAALCAGCGSTAAPSRSASAPAAAASALSLAGSEATGQAAWAVLPMGAAAGPNQFWQLFRLTAGSRAWALETPPDIATNGAPAIAGLSGAALVAGVRPSLYLAFSPVSRTSDGGQNWSAGPPAPGLASVPDALAATPGGQLLALSKSGQVSTAKSAEAAGWTKMVTTRSLAATAAGRSCGLLRLTAIAYSQAGDAMLAGDCSRPGLAGIFERAGAAWSAAGPSLPASLAGDQVQVLRLLTGTAGTTALLQVDGRAGGELVAAWQARTGRWSVSPAFSLSGSAPLTTGFGPSGSVAVVLTSGRAAILAGPGGSWQQAPRLPAGRDVTVALPGDGSAEVLVPAAGTLTVWQLAGGSWAKAQTIKVPIQYGSSS